MGGPIKGEQDEINRGSSFSLIYPAEFPLAKLEMRKSERYFTAVVLRFLLFHKLLLFRKYL